MKRARKDRQKSAAPKPTDDDQLVHELRLEVKRVITQASPTTYPTIYARLQDVQGYQQVEDAIINYVLHNNVTPGAALAQLESTWGEI